MSKRGMEQERDGAREGRSKRAEQEWTEALKRRRGRELTEQREGSVARQRG
jgi:hypothetical protein